MDVPKAVMTIIDNKTRQQQQPKTRRLALTETNCNQQSFKVKPRTPQETSRSVRHKNNMNNTKLYPSNCILPTVLRYNQRDFESSSKYCKHHTRANQICLGSGLLHHSEPMRLFAAFIDHCHINPLPALLLSARIEY